MKPLVLKSPAKLNLYLDVLNKRKDGYHNIETVFERIDLCDKISLKPIKDSRIKITSNNPELPLNERNLAYRAADLLKRRFSVPSGIHIHIFKSIPIGAGLGGGSSNAATVLLGLNRLWGLGLSQKQLLNFAQKIGSDVSFFVYKTSFALGKGRGEQINPLNKIKKRLWHILVVPRFSIATRQAYKMLEQSKLKTNILTRSRLNVKMINYLLRNKQFSPYQNLLFNVFEPLIKKKYRVIQKIESLLERLEVKTISLTGKGPAIFGLVNSRKEAARVYSRLKRHSSWQVFVVRTL